MSDTWTDVPAAPPVKADDGWVDVPASAPSGQIDTAVAKTVYPSLGPIISAFSNSARASTSDPIEHITAPWKEPLGLPPDAVKWLSEKGIFGPEKGGYQGIQGVGQAFNELLAHTVVGAVQIANRTLQSGYGAYQDIVAPLGRDVQSMPEAFFGMPHPMGIPKELPPAVEGVPRELPAPSAIEPAALPPAVAEARDLGVIGPPKPEPTFAESPSDMAERAMPRDLSAASTPEAERPNAPGHAPGEYDVRGKEWIDKIDSPEDVRDAIEKIANDHDYFPEARGGVASPAARAAVAEAAGVNPADMDAEHFSTHFDNEGKVRAVIQALRQTAKDFSEASKKAIDNPSVESAAAAAEAELRHTHVLEYTMGLRAESGRSLNAWKELLQETEHTKATVAIKSGEATGDVPRGASDVLDAVRDVKENLKTPGKKPGLQKLIDAATKLAEGDRAPSDGVSKPLSPEVSGLVDEARKVLKKLKGADDSDELAAFRKSLENLTADKGTIPDTVGAARALLKKNEKPPVEGAAEKTPSERGRLIGAAKRLVAAGEDQVKADKTRADSLADLMETARQTVGKIKDQRLATELSEFREALRSNDIYGAADAANRLIEKEAKAEPGQPKPPVGHDLVMAAARRVAAAAETEVANKKANALPPDIQSTLDDAKKAVADLRAAQESGLSKLVAQAEREVANITKQRTVKNPVEALPPELQSLVDKAGRIVDRFGGVAKGEKAALLLARTGRTAAEQEQLARSVNGLTPNQVASVLNKLRTSPDAGKPGWFYWLWQQGLISGLFTHAKYLTVNSATIFAERVVSPLVAAAIDRMRGGNASLTAPLYANVAMVHSLPNAFASAGEAFRTGQRVPLASEMRLFARGEESPQAKGSTFSYANPGPDWGIWKNVFNEDQLDNAAHVLGIPGRSANMIHTFYKVLSENASASTRAYETAAQEGAIGDKFWQRYQYHIENPTDDALRGAVNDAYSGAFMSKLGPKTTAWANALSTNPVAKWFFPFQHIPWNIERMSIEYSPLKVLGPEMRGALLGEKGAPAQNLAIAKMVVGSSVIGYFIHKALAGDATGDYPADPKERRRWELMGIQPNSINIGGWWVSTERLGPAGNVAHMGASLGQIIHQYDGQDDNALTAAIWSGSVAAANQVGNEVGFQTLKNLFEAMRSEKGGEKFVGWQASSFMYPSSFISQNASFIDPYQRHTNGLIDALKYRVPWVRESLLPKRDALGESVPNPGYHAVFREGKVNTDPVRSALDQMKFYPAPPQDHIGGVKLPPKMYDEYQATAGALTRASLESIVTAPKWGEIPPGIREQVVHSMVESARRTAGAMVQAKHPEIIMQGIQGRQDKINGVKPVKLQDQ